MYPFHTSIIGEKICSKCAGELFYKLEVKHAGLMATQLSHSLLNLALKAKHDATLSLHTLDVDRMVEPL